MPHKHKRDRSKNDASHYDLPPSKSAHPLPVKSSTSTITTTKPKPKPVHLQDDTPRAFTRLLTAYRPPRSGLDDGTRPSKKRKSSKISTSDDTVEASLATSLPPPTIQPHEPLSAFNARVDAALPFTGLSMKSGNGKDVATGRQTRMERKMQRMQREWREEEKRRKENLQEEKEEGAVDEEGPEELIKVRKKRGKKRKNGSTENSAEMDDDDEDPWAHIKAKPIGDGDTRGIGGLVGLHDVVLAPPRFSKVPKGKENFGIRKGVGGLKRQEELSEARRSVVEGYRQMMREKRGEGG